MIDKQELLERLAEKYGDLDDRCGCSVDAPNGWAWLSIANIVEIIEQCEEYED